MRLKKLEALRGFAAFYVVINHTLPHQYMIGSVNLGNLFRFGQEAVILFFLMSGFVINHTFQGGRDKTFKNYFLKRFSRIFIPLLIIMLLGYIIESVKIGGFVNPEFKSLLLNLLMLQDLEGFKPNVIVGPYMHNDPLWSLSYEWWFYMMFFPLLLVFKTKQNQNLVVYGLAIVSSLIYFIFPDFIPRLLMYNSIWWTGVYLSNKYISGSPMSYRELRVPLICLSIICVVLGLQVYHFIVSGGKSSPAIHPFLELRHQLFALIVVFLSIAWKKMKWVWFNKIFSPFACLAPMSYVIYISHFHLVVDVNYFAFINNNFAEWIAYFLCLLVFSWVIEVIIYPKLQRVFLNLTN